MVSHVLVAVYEPHFVAFCTDESASHYNISSKYGLSKVFQAHGAKSDKYEAGSANRFGSGLRNNEHDMLLCRLGSIFTGRLRELKQSRKLIACYGGSTKCEG